MTTLPSKMLVINEWVFHDITGDIPGETTPENLADARRKIYLFLEKFERSQDRIAVLYGSRWMCKLLSLIRHEDPAIVGLSRLIRSLILDSDKGLRLEFPKVESIAPDEVVLATPERDRYLIKTYYAAHADFLITSDVKLQSDLSHFDDVKVVLKDDFLKCYLKE